MWGTAMQGTLHANLGRWLQQQQHTPDEAVLVGPAAHPTLVLTFGKASVSFGALVVVLTASHLLCPSLALISAPSCGCMT